MDKSTLSKHKFLYRVYIDSDDKVHIVKYKVAYINSVLVYYIVGNKQPLECVRLKDQVFDSVEEYVEKNAAMGMSLFSGLGYMRFWSVTDGDPNELRKTLLKKHEELLNKQKLEAYEGGVRAAEYNLKRARERLEYFKREAGIDDES